MSKTAITSAPIAPVLADRWSPRAYDSSYIPTQHELLSVLEAARWAPSANNAQPWRFHVLHAGTPLHAAFVETLSGFNQAWVPNAPITIVISARTVNADGTPARMAFFDAGLAAQNLMTQATELGLSTHPLSGYDHAAAKTALSLPEGYESVVAITLGKLGNPDTLSEGACEREVAPRTRLDLDELVLNGKP